MEILLLIAIVVLAVQISGLKKRLRSLEDQVTKQASSARTAAAFAPPESVSDAPIATPLATSGPEPLLREAPLGEFEADEGFLDTHPGQASPPVAQPAVARPSPARAAEPSMIDRDLGEWPLVQLLKQNLFAVAGVCLLLLGFTFLFRSIEWGQLLPPWARIGMAYAATAGLAWAGMRWSASKPLWAQIAQGGAAGVAYLATYIATTRYGLFSSPVAMLLFAGISLALVLRALRENSKVLAAIGFLGAYAAPMLALDRGGPLDFNLGYGLLVTAFALWVSYRRRWIEIAIHAHLCAAGLAAITYSARAEPLAPWLQQALLHGYLVQLLLWTVAWARRWLPADGERELPDTESAVLLTCLAATTLCYLALQSWLLPAQLSFIAVAFAGLLVALGLTAFRDRRHVREAAWVLAALSLVLALHRQDLAAVFKGLGLLLEGVFLMLTVRRPGGVRAWLGRGLIVVGSLVILGTDSHWALAVLLLATMALALWKARRVPAGTTVAHDLLDGLLFSGLSTASLAALMAALTQKQPVLWLVGFTAVSALQAAIAMWRCRLGVVPALFVIVTGASWCGLALLPDKQQPGLQLATLTGLLFVAVAGLWRFLPQHRGDLRTPAAGVGSLLLLLLPALFLYKLSAGMVVLASAAVLALVVKVWLTNGRVLARLWRLEDDSVLRGLVIPMTHLLAVLAVALWVALPDMSGAAGITLALLAFLASVLTWVVHGGVIDVGVRRVAGASFAIVGLFSWLTAASQGSTQSALRLTLSSQLLPVLLTGVAVAFLFHASRAGQRLAWGAAAAVCALSSVKLLLSLGSALLSPLGVAASLLGMGALLLLAGYLAPLPPDEEAQAG